jgi:hypothetical protein
MSEALGEYSLAGKRLALDKARQQLVEAEAGAILATLNAEHYKDGPQGAAVSARAVAAHEARGNVSRLRRAVERLEKALADDQS